MTPLSMTDLLSSLDVLFQQDITDLKHILTRQESVVPEDIPALVPRARSLLLRKILSRMLIVCCEEKSTSTDQELKVLHDVIGALLIPQVPAGSPLTDLERQKQGFDKQTAEFSKNIAQKEKMIADQITKSQQHIAGLQQKMMSKAG